MLFTMLSGKAPFESAADQWYQRWLDDPVAAASLRGIDLGKDAIELIVSMIARDPKGRPTLAQIKNTPWFQEGQMASQQQVSEHFGTVQNA